MPKPKPDEVIRHEIVLGRAERELVRDLQMSYTFNRVITPFTDISSGGAVLLGGSLVLLIDYILDSIGLDPDWREIIKDMTPEQVSDWFESQNLVLGGIGAIIGTVFFGWPGAIVGGVAGSAAAEAGEAALEDWEEHLEAEGPPAGTTAAVGFFTYLMTIRNQYLGAQGSTED